MCPTISPPVEITKRTPLTVIFLCRSDLLFPQWIEQVVVLHDRDVNSTPGLSEPSIRRSRQFSPLFIYPPPPPWASFE